MSSSGSSPLASPTVAPSADGGFPTLTFEVVKKHHRMPWLKQNRLLILTTTGIQNAKPGNPPSITKDHPWETLSVIAVKTKTSFMLQFRGDHEYFYNSPRTLDILWEVNKRIGALKVVNKLLSYGTAPGGMTKNQLLGMFAEGRLVLPSAHEKDELCFERRIDMVRAIRGFAVDGAKEILQLQAQLESTAVGVDIGKLRERLDSLKATVVAQITSTRTRSFSATLNGTLRNRVLPIFEELTDAVVAAEEALQLVVVVPAAVGLWNVLRTEGVVRMNQLAFDQNCLAMQKQTPESLGVRDIFFALELRNCSRSIRGGVQV